MRVVAGKARGVRLGSVPGYETRPTANRVKEALFSILQPRIGDAVFLDLFAGNGGIGIEALSRGAARAVFVDAKPACTRMIKENLARARLDDAEVLTMRVERAIQRLREQQKKFDIIFLDPPYGKGFIVPTLAALWEADIVQPDAVIIAEYGVKEEIDLSTSKFQLVRQEKYGDTVLGFFTLREDVE